MANGHGGRRPGAGHPRALINEYSVKYFLRQGMSLTKVAERFEVSRPTIRRIAVEAGLMPPLKQPTRRETHEHH